MKITKQKEHVSELLNLVGANPDLRIVPMVDTEIVADDGFQWWVASFGKARVEEIYSNDERLYIRSEDEETLIDDLCCDDDTDGLSDEEIEELAKQKVASYKWEKVIAVRINLP